MRRLQMGLVDLLLIAILVGGLGAFFRVASSDWDCSSGGASWSRSDCLRRATVAPGPVVLPASFGVDAEAECRRFRESADQSLYSACVSDLVSRYVGP